MENESETIILEEINKATSQSLKKKLLFVKKLSKDREVIEKDYIKELIQIQYSYEEKYKKIYEEASKIIHGQITDLGHLVNQSDIDHYKLNNTQTTPLEQGVPCFWEKALINSKYFFTNKTDEVILKFLRDIKMDLKDDKVSFSVVFKFDPNDYFNNLELVKTYHYNENQELERVESSAINWNSDEKNPMKELKKKKKKKGKDVKTTSTWEEVDSFFKIFKGLNTKDVEDDYEISEEERESEFFKDDLLPNALGYFLDIIPIDADEDEEEEEDDDEEEDKNKKVTKDEGKEKCKNQ